MPNYIVNRNAQPNGDHEVHTTDCSHLPDGFNRVDLGWHSNCRDAVREAKVNKGYATANGCYYCCNECHTR